MFHITRVNSFLEPLHYFETFFIPLLAILSLRFKLWGEK